MAELFEYFLRSPTAHCKYAQGSPSVIGREFHDYDEAVLFLDGNAHFHSENIQMKLTPGSVIFIPREKFHRFAVTDTDRYRRVILGFRAEGELGALVRREMTEVRVFSEPSEAVLSVFRTLSRAAEAGISPTEQELLLTASVTELLLGQRLSVTAPGARAVGISPPIRALLSYIEEHIGEELSLDALAAMLCLSPSALSHRFKRELGISVYRYVSEKRLSAVRLLVERGRSLGDAAALCGFADYSSFYRMYRKCYGVPPSKTEKSKSPEKFLPVEVSNEQKQP